MKKIFRFLGEFEANFAELLLVVLTILLFVQILNRYLFHQSFVWIEEICRISFVWLIYFSVAFASKENRHVRVKIIDMFLPAFPLKVATLVADTLWVGFNLAIAWFGLVLVKSTIEYEYRSPVTEIHMGAVYFVIPFCFALMAFRVIFYNIKNIKNPQEPVSADHTPE